MRLTRARDLLLAGVVAAVVVHLLLRLAYELVPPLPTLGGVTLLVLAIIEAGLAWSMRARIGGKPGTTRPQPLTAVRTVALAKASSVLGALMVGAWAGVLAYVVPIRAQTQAAAAANDTTSAAVGLVSAAVLIAAALWLERCCRTPPEGDQRRDNDRQ